MCFSRKNIIMIITVFIPFKILSRETSLSAHMHTHTHRHYTHRSGVKNMAGLLFWKKKCLEVRVEVRLELKESREGFS